MLEKLKKILKWAACLAGGALLVTNYPVVATGFMAAYVTKYTDNEYGKVILGALASVVMLALLMNFAELAVIAAAFPVCDFVTSWAEHVRYA